MKLPLVITLVGLDRTGLVESVAQAVASHGGNWLESRMCRLGGEFAGILRIEIPAERKTDLLATLQTIPGLNVVVQPGRPGAPASAARQMRLEIIGSDRPGIVREITRALTRANVNVEEFSSERTSAPMSVARTLRPRRVKTRFGNNCRRPARRYFLCGSPGRVTGMSFQDQGRVDSPSLSPGSGGEVCPTGPAVAFSPSIAPVLIYPARDV
jgi:glycine cleavage system regulatory protein